LYYLKNHSRIEQMIFKQNISENAFEKRYFLEKWFWRNILKWKLIRGFFMKINIISYFSFCFKYKSLHTFIEKFIKNKQDILLRLEIKNIRNQKSWKFSVLDVHRNFIVIGFHIYYVDLIFLCFSLGYVKCVACNWFWYI